MIYNTRKPSLSFHLNKSVISLYDGGQSLKRETQFEEDLHWKKYLIDLDSEEESTYLKQVLTTPTVLIVYKNILPEKRRWIQNAYKHKKVMEKWSVYY